MSLLVFLGVFGLFKPEITKAAIYHLTFDYNSGFYVIPPEISQADNSYQYYSGWFIVSGAGEAVLNTTWARYNIQEWGILEGIPHFFTFNINGKNYIFLIEPWSGVHYRGIQLCFQSCSNQPEIGDVYLSFEPISIENLNPIVELFQPENNDYVFDEKENFWGLRLKNLSAIPNLPKFADLRIDYWSINNPEIIFRDEVYPVLIPENPSDFDTYLNKNTSLMNGAYQARAILIVDENTYQSETIYFNIIGGASPSPSPPVYPSMSPYPSTPPELSPPPYAGSEEICQSPPGGFLDYPVQNLTFAICKAFTFLFLPSESQRNTLSSFLNNWSDNLKKKPPFGYFYLIKSAFSGIDTTATSTEYNFEIPVIGDTLKQAIIFLFWLIAVAYVIFRIKSIL